jgi:hypothetical protein
LISADPIVQTLNLYPDEMAALLEKKDAVVATVKDLRL